MCTVCDTFIDIYGLIGVAVIEDKTDAVRRDLCRVDVAACIGHRGTGPLAERLVAVFIPAIRVNITPVISVGELNGDHIGSRCRSTVDIEISAKGAPVTLVGGFEIDSDVACVCRVNNVLITHTAGIPCGDLAVLDLDRLDSVGSGEGRAEHILAGVSGILTELVCRIRFPLGHGTDQIIAVGDGNGCLSRRLGRRLSGLRSLSRCLSRLRCLGRCLSRLRCLSRCLCGLRRLSRCLSGLRCLGRCCGGSYSRLYLLRPCERGMHTDVLISGLDLVIIDYLGQTLIRDCQNLAIGNDPGLAGCKNFIVGFYQYIVVIIKVVRLTDRGNGSENVDLTRDLTVGEPCASFRIRDDREHLLGIEDIALFGIIRICELEIIDVIAL